MCYSVHLVETFVSAAHMPLKLQKCFDSKLCCHTLVYVSFDEADSCASFTHKGTELSCMRVAGSESSASNSGGQ
jgi:hypothetical protein